MSSPNLKKRNTAVSDSKKLSSSLRQALEMMNHETNKSFIVTQSLISSNEILGKSDQNLSSFSSLMGSSFKIMKNLQKKEWFERLLILFGLLIFFSSVLYIISKRF